MIVINGLNDREHPDKLRLLAARDGAQLDEVMNTEQHALYVAATRAQGHIRMSGVDSVSEFSVDLLGE